MIRANKRNTYYIRYFKAEGQSIRRVRRVLWVELIEEALREVGREEGLNRCLEERSSKQTEQTRHTKAPRPKSTEQAWSISKVE